MKAATAVLLLATLTVWATCAGAWSANEGMRRLLPYALLGAQATDTCVGVAAAFSARRLYVVSHFSSLAHDDCLDVRLQNQRTCCSVSVEIPQLLGAHHRSR